MSTSSQQRRHKFLSSLDNAGRRRLAVEGLEHRQVLAGNVLATMVGGNLMIQGDVDDNAIHLHTAADGTVEVSGLEAGAGATTINGSTEPFVATGVRHLTRVHLGRGDDSLQISTEVDAETDGQNSDGLLGNLMGRKHLLINTGIGSDTVDAEVAADVSVHLLGNQAQDDVSISVAAERDVDTDIDAEIDADIDAGIDAAATNLNLAANVNADVTTSAVVGPEETEVSGGLESDLSAALKAQVAASQQPVAEFRNEFSAAAGADATANVDVDADLDANLVSDLNASPQFDITADADLDADVDVDVNTEANVATDATTTTAANVTGNLTGDVDPDVAVGIGTNADLDTTITANLLLDAALDSVSNVGSDSLLNVDNNLNGAIGGSAALNLLGDGGVDDITEFNASGIANLSVSEAANLALLNANSFALTTNAADDFFASLGNQSQLNASSDLNAQASLLNNLGNLDTQANAGLSGSLNTSFNGVFNSRLGTVPLA
jgi:hypothetical protein